MTDFLTPPSSSEIETERLTAEDRIRFEQRYKANGGRTGSDSRSPALIATKASEVEIKPVEWLWPGRIPQGKLTLLAGEPGAGKSTLTYFLAAAVTVGADFPRNEGHCPGGGSVIIFSAEDDMADTIAPRLMAAGADLECVEIITGVSAGIDRARSFNLATDLPALKAKIAEMQDLRLIVIDPIASYLGRADSHKNAEVRAVLEPLVQVAAETGAAVVGVTHFAKSPDIKAMNKIIGSIGFVGVARAAFVVVRDPESEDDARRLFLRVKGTLARDLGGLAFRIEQLEVKPGIVPSCARWLEDEVMVTADDVMASEKDSASPTARAEAESVLRTILKDAPRPQTEVKRETKQAGVSWRTVERAKRDLGVIAKRSGGAGADGWWEWSLPDTGQQPQRRRMIKNAPLTQRWRSWRSWRP